MTPTDPVHQVNESQAAEHGYNGPGWYFWDETWADRHGPFTTRLNAINAMMTYIKDALEGDKQ